MKFNFNVNMNDDDYLYYNKFWLTRSPYGKKQINTGRLVLLVVALLYLLMIVVSDGFDVYSISAVLVVFTLVVVLYPQITAVIQKISIKLMKKQGKMAYTPSSVLEFFEDNFTESTEQTKSEFKYSTVEQISYVDGKVIYLHLNNVAAIILPNASFESKEQFDAFFVFIRGKCSNIKVY